MNILLDTNILVRLAERTAVEHPLCVSAVERLAQQGHTLYLCAQTAIEFWSVATRPKTSNGLGLTPADADAALTEAEGWSEWLLEPPDIATRWRHLVLQSAVCGRQVHDTRLVAVYDAYGLDRLLTLNTADFIRYPGVRLLHPGDVK
jgi:predicted nucleic acid-binding protein